MREISTPLNTAAAAAYTGLSKSSLEKLRVYGGGPRFLKVCRLVRYRTEDLDAWLSERVFSSTSEHGVLDRARGSSQG
jgi:predicted DNA-binding transcriptional regulator AlpA